jgi:hypothetical protein
VTAPGIAPESTTRAELHITDSVHIRRGDHPTIPQPMFGLLEGRVTLMAGAGGAGKTTLGEQIIRHLCSGHRLGQFPLPDEPMRGWFMVLEDEKVISQDRSLRVAALGELAEDTQDSSCVKYMHGRDFWNIATLTQQLEEAKAEERLPGIIIVDHLRILIGDQPSGTTPNDWERRNLLRLVDLAGEYGVHMVVLTHMNKEGKVSGTTELTNCVDAAFVVEPKDDRQFATLKCHKMRMAPETDYALSRKANGTWGFDDQLFVSETLAQGIARDILAVLRTQGPQTLSQLCMHPAVSGTRRGVQQALTRARKSGWVKTRAGHWEIIPGDGDKAVRAPGDCSVCGLRMDKIFVEGQTAHPGCDVERHVQAASVPAPAEPEPESAPATDNTEASEDAPDGFQGISALRNSVAKSRMKPLPCVPKDERDAAPWSLMYEQMGGEPAPGRHLWVAPGFAAEEVRKDPEPDQKKGKLIGYRVVDAEGRGGQLLTLDRNGSYLSACSSVPVAPNALKNTGPLERYDAKQAGIYQIELPEWTEPDMPHPLGVMARRAEPGALVWVSTPHMRLVTKLAEADRIAPLIIRDSWTGRANESLFEGFYRQCRTAREVLYGTGKPYVQYKASASSALRILWPKEAKSPFWRPDWRVSVVAEASVRHWVQADRAVKMGAVLASLKSVDEAVFWTPDGAVPAPYTEGAAFGQVKIKGE